MMEGWKDGKKGMKELGKAKRLVSLRELSSYQTKPQYRKERGCVSKLTVVLKARMYLGSFNRIE